MQDSSPNLFDDHTSVALAPNFDTSFSDSRLGPKAAYDLVHGDIFMLAYITFSVSTQGRSVLGSHFRHYM